uniref:Coiled-coil domain containing 50 n=1 Tax=Podarcis muralis TaxID=64176 RepID=A0A670KFM6_PODMU
MAEISIDQSKLPGVKEVCRDFAVLEDHTLAHSLQEQEIEHHLATNVQRNRLVQYDLQMAKQLQEEEDRKARARIQERHKDLERQDCEIAQEIQVKLVIEAEQRRRQEEDDEDIARILQQKELQEEKRRKKPHPEPLQKSTYDEGYYPESRGQPRGQESSAGRPGRGNSSPVAGGGEEGLQESQGTGKVFSGKEEAGARLEGLPLRPPRIWTSFVTLQASRTWHIKHPDQSLLIKVTTINSRTNEAFFFLLILTLFCSKLCWNPSWRSPGFLPASKDLPGDGLLPEHRDVHKQCLFFSPLSFSLGDLPPVSWAGQLNLAFVGQLFHSPPLPSRILVLGSRRAVFRPPLPSEDLVGLGRGQPKQAQGRRVERAPQRSSSLTRCNAGITA